MTSTPPSIADLQSRYCERAVKDQPLLQGSEKRNHQRKSANEANLLVIAVELRRRIRRRKFLFSETARPKSFPSSPSFPMRRLWQCFDQTGAPERHPPGGPAPQSRSCCGKLGELGKLFSRSRGWFDLNLRRHGTSQPSRYQIGRGHFAAELRPAKLRATNQLRLC